MEVRYAGTDQSCSFASPKGWVAIIGLRTDAMWGRMKRDGEEEEPLSHSLPRRLRKSLLRDLFSRRNRKWKFKGNKEGFSHEIQYILALSDGIAG